jgi:pyruvate kinase
MPIDTRVFTAGTSHTNASAHNLTIRTRKRTKIVATIGPASSSEDVVRALFQAGINLARLNMSHGDHSDHLARLQLIRRISKELERPVAILADLQGPKIRTGRLKDNQPVEWNVGDQVVITVADCPEGTAKRIGTTYSGLARDVIKGNVMLIDDGRMRVEVDHVDGDDIHGTVLVGGWLKSNKGINLPGVKVSTPSISEKDKADLAWAIANDVDYIALSFVRTARDVRNLKNRIAESGRDIPVISKIEKPEAVEHIDEILQETDGIMVARGDLGIEISTQRLPVVQKDLITKANRIGKLVITATQMLESMIENPIPTRAESSDVANAIFDGSDAVMLSGETASGKYPIEAVAEMTRIAAEAEKSPYMATMKLDRSSASVNAFSFAFTGAADYLSREINANGVMILSNGIEKALLLSKRRANMPMVALCYDERTWRQMSLFWGVIPLLIPFMDNLQDLLEKASEECLRFGIFKEGDTVVVITGMTAAGANTIKVHLI